MALGEIDGEGDVRIRAVVSRDLPNGACSEGLVHSTELVASTVAEMFSELGSREKRCVLGVGAPAAALRVVRFPSMSSAERTRAAGFEATRIAPWNIGAEETVVRVHAFTKSQGLYAVGAVRRRTLESRIAVAKSARLRVVAIDHETLALRRAFPACDAVLDIGRDRSILHTFCETGPLSSTIAVGGSHVTNGIARDLSIEIAIAEKRKRILGSAGAGAAVRAEIVAAFAQAIERARARAPVARVALTGNGARLPGLSTELETAASVIATMPVTEMLCCDAYPEDVVRAAAPDWTLAVALASWGAAA